MNYDYMNINNLIHDKELEKIKVIENNEKLILIQEESWLKINNFSSTFLNISLNKFICRSKIFRMLKKAKKDLPTDYSFLIIDGYRPIKWQLQRFLIQFAKLYQKYPNMDFEKLYWETSKWTAPIFGIKPPHPTGGAVDITLLYQGKEIDMGTKVNEFNEKTETLSNSIIKLQKKNRELLIMIMSKAGFVNYPTEWWHWSYGDQYWAVINKTNAIYDIIEK